MAFFQAFVRPAAAVRWRRALPRTFSVLTLVTFTLKSSCTASRICCLFARGSATTVYWLSFSPWRVPFSVRRAVLIMSKAFMCLVRETFFEFLKRRPAEEQFVTAQHLVSIEVVGGGHFDLLQVPSGQAKVLFDAWGHDQRGAGDFKLLEHVDKAFGPGRVQLEIIHDDDIAGIEAFGQSLAQRELFRLAADLLAEIARLGSEDHAATDPKW